MTGDRLDNLLLAGGALWASIAVHGIGLVATGVLEEVPPDRITIELVAPQPASEAPPAQPQDVPAATEAEAEAGAERLPSPSTETGEAEAKDGAAAPAPSALSWRERLRRDKRAFEREQREVARRLALLPPTGAGGTQGGVYRCGVDGAAALSDVKVRRDLSRLAPIFPGRVLSDAYLAAIGEVGAERVGDRMAFDLVLPTELLTIRLEQPDVLVAVGREDRRCFVRITVGADLFPLHLLGLPVRAVDAAGTVRAAVVDVALNIDATVDILAVHEGALGFRAGRLTDAEALARRMREHRGIFRALKALSGD